MEVGVTLCSVKTYPNVLCAYCDTITILVIRSSFAKVCRRRQLSEHSLTISGFICNQASRAEGVAAGYGWVVFGALLTRAPKFIIS